MEGIFLPSLGKTSARGNFFLDAFDLNLISIINPIHAQQLTCPKEFISHSIANMVKLTEVEDEHYSEKPTGLDGEVLLEDDDDDNYTDTGNNLT